MRRGRRREGALAGVVLLLALFLFFLPAALQTPVRQVVRGTALRPFLEMQAALISWRERNLDVNVVRAQRDSLAAVVAAQATLSEENRRLRALLGLSSRAEAEFIPAELIRVGAMGGESTFLLNVGRADGIDVGSPVIAVDGLLGVVREAGEHTSQAIDWTHPDFRASAMTASGDAYGIVEPRRGRFREEDLLALTGTPFRSDVPAGTRIVTSGRGGIYPRGIPIGGVVGIEEADTGWRKSYLLRPEVRPASVIHVLVAVRQGQESADDISSLWHVPAPPDTLADTEVGADAAEADSDVAAPARTRGDTPETDRDGP